MESDIQPNQPNQRKSYEKQIEDDCLQCGNQIDQINEIVNQIDGDNEVFNHEYDEDEEDALYRDREEYAMEYQEEVDKERF